MTEFEQAVAIIQNLSPIEKVRLVRQIMASLEQNILQSQAKPKRSLRGLWSDVNVSSEDIDEAPREDI